MKVVNYNHLMPTRYTLDVDLKSVVTPDVMDNSTKKVAAQKESKTLLEERFKTGKNRWYVPPPSPAPTSRRTAAIRVQN